MSESMLDGQQFVYPPGVRVEQVAFPAGGAEGGMAECAGTLYFSDAIDDPAPRPGIVLAWSGITPKEANTGVAWYLARAGYVCLAFDYRTSGASTGKPRGQVYFANNVQDMRSALLYLRSRPEVDPEAIGLHGVSPSGAIAMRLAARDRRVKCVSALYPSTLFGYGDLLPQSLIEADFDRRFATGEGATMPYLNVDGWPEPGKGYARLSLEMYPGFDNQMLVESLEKFDDWYPARFAEWVSPTPLQFVGANGSDIYHDLEQMTRAMELVKEPKRLVVLGYDGMGMYVEPGLGDAMRATIGWFDHHLRGRSLEPVPPPGETVTTPLAPEAVRAGIVPGTSNWQPSWDPGA
ncbi:alpha/beta hydrolase [Flindersiella endophytica]